LCLRGCGCSKLNIDTGHLTQGVETSLVRVLIIGGHDNRSLRLGDRSVADFVPLDAQPEEIAKLGAFDMRDEC